MGLQCLHWAGALTLEDSWIHTPLDPHGGKLSVLFWNSTTKGEKPLHSMQGGIGDGSDAQQHGHRDTKAPGCQQQSGGCVCDQSAKGRCLRCSVEHCSVCSPLPETSVLTQEANPKLGFHSVSSSCTPRP